MAVLNRRKVVDGRTMKKVSGLGTLEQDGEAERAKVRDRGMERGDEKRQKSKMCISILPSPMINGALGVTIWRGMDTHECSPIHTYTHTHTHP